MPVDHGHLQAVRQADAGGFADLIAPAVLQRREHDHHDRGENHHGRCESPLFDGVISCMLIRHDR